MAKQTRLGATHRVSAPERRHRAATPPTVASTAAPTMTKAATISHIAGASLPAGRPGPIIHETAQPSVASVRPRTAPASAAVRRRRREPALAAKYPVAA